MMAAVILETRYECDECGLLWDGEDDAATCCPRMARQVEAYVCVECGQAYCYVEDAIACCPEED